MGARTQHAPGTFSWVDLTTSDADGAKAFYTGLFGWEPDDRPIPDDGVYTMLNVGGASAAALFESGQGGPPAWNSYVTVESADEAATRAEENGAGVVMGPLDVMDAGRMAVLQDPTGAFVSVWEPRENIGAGIVNEPGALTLNQLNTSDPERSQQFYSAMFGWRFEQMQGEEPAYWGIYNGDRVNGGMMGASPDAWLVYFGCEDVDADATRIGELGGSLIVEPMDVPGGRILVAQDPQGAVFGLFAGRFDD